MVQDPVKHVIHAPDGEYRLHSAKSHSCNFNDQRPARLTFATASNGSDGTTKLIIYNSSDSLNLAYYATIDKAAHRQILVSGGAHSVYPTCHDHVQNVPGYDLVVGLSSGDVVVGSVQAQMKAPVSNIKMVEMVHFNKAGQIDPTRAVDVAFLPGSHGGYFIAAHESGTVYTYCTTAGTSSSGGSPSSKIPQQNGCPKPTASIKVSDLGLTSCTVSPDASKIASTARDGILYVHELPTGNLVGGFRSFYGGLNCCAWSHDGRYVAVGGEDDLVCVYGLLEQRQVFFGEGHESWVSRVSFDRWASNIEGSQKDEDVQEDERIFSGPERTTYRIVSVGQDCRVCFWDFVAEDEDYFGSEEEHERAPLLNQAPAGIHKRTPSSSAVNAMAMDSALNGLPPSIQPPVKRSQMDLSPPVASEWIHHDPCSDVIFMKDAMYTATHCCELRCWLRPNRAESKSSGQPTSAQNSQ